MKKKLLDGGGYPDTPLQRHLEAIGACDLARGWAASRTPKQAWEQCPNCGWLLWWAEKAAAQRVRIGQSVTQVVRVQENAYTKINHMLSYTDRYNARLEYIRSHLKCPYYLKCPAKKKSVKAKAKR